MNARSRSIAAAVALLFITGGVVANTDQRVGAVQIRCSGINSCKGQSFCATAKNACAGQNGCKGQGWLKVSREECSAKGGQVLPDQDN
jgi:hypothetical protein